MGNLIVVVFLFHVFFESIVSFTPSHNMLEYQEQISLSYICIACLFHGNKISWHIKDNPDLATTTYKGHCREPHVTVRLLTHWQQCFSNWGKDTHNWIGFLLSNLEWPQPNKARILFQIQTRSIEPLTWVSREVCPNYRNYDRNQKWVILS